MRRRSRDHQQPEFAVRYYLAAGNLSRTRGRQLLMGLLIAMCVVSYTVVSYVGGRVALSSVQGRGMGLGRMLLVVCKEWQWTQRVCRLDPRLVEVAAEDWFWVRSYLGDEAAGGKLYELRNHSNVASASLMRLLPLLWPWGVRDLLSVPGGDALWTQLKLTHGRKPDSFDEIALPSTIAWSLGLKPGSEVPYSTPDPLTGRKLSGKLRVSGIYAQGDFTLAGAIGWLPDSYAGHDIRDVPPEARKLSDIEPNGYSLALRPRISSVTFIQHLTEGGTSGSGGGPGIRGGHMAYSAETDGPAFFAGERYPVARTWCEESIVQSLADTARMGEATGAVVLSLAFVGIAVLTIFLLTFLDRRREVAILKAIGLCGYDVAWSFALEMVCVGTLGVVSGTLMAVALFALIGWSLSPAVLSTAVLGTAAVLVVASALPVRLAGAATVSELLGGRSIRISRRRIVASSAGL
jgi:hypothetical protein